MAWISPVSRATGYLVTAARWNQDIVDNAQYLKGRALIHASAVQFWPGRTGHGGAGPSGPRPNTVQTNLLTYELAFAADADQSAYALVAVPLDYAAGLAQLRVRLSFVTSGTTGDVAWRLRAAKCAGKAGTVTGESWDSLSFTGGSSVSGTVTVAPPAGTLFHWEANLNAPTGLAARDLLAFELTRRGSLTGDTLTAEARMVAFATELG